MPAPPPDCIWGEDPKLGAVTIFVAATPHQTINWFHKSSVAIPVYDCASLCKQERKVLYSDFNPSHAQLMSNCFFTRTTPCFDVNNLSKTLLNASLVSEWRLCWTVFSSLLVTLLVSVVTGVAANRSEIARCNDCNATFCKLVFRSDQWEFLF